MNEISISDNQCRTKLNQLSSPFLRLSAELRNAIYERYCEDTKWLVHGEAGPRDDPMAPHVQSLLLVCRQIYSEAALFPYSHGTISANNCAFFKVWLLSRSRSQINAIAKLELQCGLFLGGRNFTQWTMPIPRDGSVLSSFPNLKSVHVSVEVAGVTRAGVAPEERDAHRQIKSAMNAFRTNIPHVEITATYSPSKRMAEIWKPREGMPRVDYGAHVAVLDDEVVQKIAVQRRVDSVGT